MELKKGVGQTLTKQMPVGFELCPKRTPNFFYPLLSLTNQKTVRFQRALVLPGRTDLAEQFIAAAG